MAFFVGSHKMSIIFYMCNNWHIMSTLEWTLVPIVCLVTLAHVEKIAFWIGINDSYWNKK